MVIGVGCRPQRGKGAGIIGFTTSACMYVGSMLGVLIGQGVVTHDQAFAFMLTINIANIPLGCLAVQDRPGCFTAERPAPPSARLPLCCNPLFLHSVFQQGWRGGACKMTVSPTARPAPPPAVADRGKSCTTLASETCCSGRRLCAMVRNFLSAFRDSPAYSRMFLQSFVGTLNPFGSFLFYW